MWVDEYVFYWDASAISKQINNDQVQCNVSTVFLICLAFGHEFVSLLEYVVFCCRVGEKSSLA